MEPKHTSVLLEQAVDALTIKPDHWYIDATFGRGGHTQEMLNHGGKIIAFDYDATNIEYGMQQFRSEVKAKQLLLVRENFDQMLKIVQGLSTQGVVDKINGVLFDFGTTTEQLMDTNSGLSFQGGTAELDMRLDDRLGVKAKDLLALIDEKQLQKLFSEYGGEREAKKIASEIVKRRQEGEFITTVQQLVSLIETVKAHQPRHIHPATKVFQALRIAVNDELDNIERALPQALSVIESNCKIVTIAFHEGEDRLCKQIMRTWEENGLGKRTPKDVITPSLAEIQQNPRARSAKMRVFTKKAS